MKKIKDWFIENWETVIAVIIFVLINLAFNRAGYDRGFNKGLDLGFTTTMDTVLKITGSQIRDTTKVSRVTMIGSKDTVTYILSAKTLKEKLDDKDL
jgi:hypothetical protein